MTGLGAGFVADEAGLAGHGGGGAVALAAVLDAEVVVCCGGRGGQAGLGGRDAEFHRHQIVGRDEFHSFVARRFGVAAGVGEAIGGFCRGGGCARGSGVWCGGTG